MTPLDQFIAAVSDELTRAGWNLSASGDETPDVDEGSIDWAIRKHAHILAGTTPDRAAEIRRDIAETEVRLKKMRRELAEIGGAA